MGQDRTILKLMLALGLSTTLAACGGSSSPSKSTDTTDTSTTTTTTTTSPDGSSSGSDNGASAYVGDNQPYTVRIVNPTDEATVDENWGYYRTKVTVLVQDSEGHAVADGTPVYLSVIDAVLAQGVIDASGITASSTTLTDTDATLGDGATATSLDQAYVNTNDTVRYIESGDHILLVDGADTEDKIRYVGDTAATATTLTTSTAYTNSYPDAARGYAAGDTQYVVGASLSGTQIAGVYVDENLAESVYPTPGVALTRDGKAYFRLTYPADYAGLNWGCNPSLDPRAQPLGSGRVYLAASVNDSVTTINDTFCFAPITTDASLEAVGAASYTISPGTSGTITVPLYIVDGGNKIGVPYYNIGAVAASASFSVTVTDNTTGNGYITTDGSGWGYANITYTNALAGQEATVSFIGLDQTADVTLSVNDAALDLFYDAYTIAAGSAGTITVNVHLTDADTGEGIPNTDLEIMFNAPFSLTATDANTGNAYLTTDANGWAQLNIDYNNGVATQEATVSVLGQGQQGDITITVE